ncbi:MAG: hypothetical protein LBE56_14950 [Tannerella sp.]|nr:hypothetical protein [Tannerella sp.]
MNFISSYLTRYKALPQYFAEAPDKDVNIIVSIPCYDDECVFETLQSLEDTHPVQSKVEVIVVVNDGAATPSDVIARNRKIFSRLQQQADEMHYRKFRLLPMLVEGTPRKKAGVGFARKAGMDEAAVRFAAIDRPEGLIVSLDADTLVASNYLQVAEKAYNNSAAQCFTFEFQHLYEPERYSEAEIRACRLYELYLRYFRSALKMLNVPYAIHSIGSCFAVRAEAYTKLGGMSMRQAGEDFYFLQKAVKMQPVCEMSEVIVFPSPRISTRVPFGTGASVRNIVAEGSYYVYNFELFKLLKTFYDLFPSMESADVQSQIPSEILHFIGSRPFNEALTECRKYTSSPKAFLKRMYDRFYAFFIVKFLNTFDKDSAYPPMDVLDAVRLLSDEIPSPE